MIRLCIASQTPPLAPLGPRPANPALWRLGKEYVPQIGGVVPMMRALLHQGPRAGISPDPLWVALGGKGIPPRARTDEGYTVETVPLEPELRGGYVRFKDAVWRSFHGPWGLEPFSSGDYRAYMEFNSRIAQQLLRHADAYDVFYVNDFQLLLVGGLVGSAAPALLRWHIPLELRGYPEPVRRFFLRSMEGFDAIVVSTRSALEGLIRFGFRGRAFQVYPYLDPAEHGRSPPGAVRRFRERHGLGDHPYLLSVGRMDPVKRQDLLLRAFAQIGPRFPDLRLVLVGGESFSTRLAGPNGGPAKDVAWTRKLAGLLRPPGLAGRVVSTGRISAEELRAAYDGAIGLVHPAPWEGFGLVAVEAWMHRLPVIVSRGAGVAELVTEGVNGFTVPPGSVPALASRMSALLAHPERASRMGEAGESTARRCHVRVAASRLREVFAHMHWTYRARGRMPPAILRG